MIFPQLGPEYIQRPSDENILSRIQTFYAESITINQAFWSEAHNDTLYEAGDQSFYNNNFYGNLPTNRRRQFSFNHVKPIINNISGYQRKNRKSTICVPIENGDAETADQFTKILMYIARNEGVLETISRAFHGSLVTGMNLLYVWNDYRNDPVSGNIKVDCIDYSYFLMDPYFKKPDLSDCRALLRRQFMTKRQILSILPQYEEEIMGIHGRDSGTARDGKFQFASESYSWSVNNLLIYDEFWYQDFRTQRILVDTKTGESMEWTGKDEEALKMYLQLYPQVTIIKQEIPTVRLAITVENKVLYNGPNPLGIDRYPFVPVFAYYNPQIPDLSWRICGIARQLRDAQFLYNRRKVIELDALESQINSGWIAKENSLVNPKDIFLVGQGRTMFIKEDAQMTDLVKIPAAGIDASWLQVSKILADEMPEISGVNKELLGSAVDEQAGILSMLRQGAGLTGLQPLFDNLDYAQKLLGQIMLEIIQANYTPGKVQTILEGKQPAPQFYNKAFGKYGCTVEEGLNTTTQRQMQFAQLLQLRQVGVPVPDEELLEVCIVQNKKELVESIQRVKQQQEQAQQAQLQAQIAEQMARTNLAKARAVADEGLGIERASRVQENQALAVERRAQAHRDEESGFLDLVKAFKELEGLDIDQIQKLIQISRLLKDESGETQGESPNASTNPAQRLSPEAIQNSIPPTQEGLVR